MRDLLRSLWREPRPADPPPRTWWDWALVAVMVVLAVVEGVLRPGMAWRDLWVIVEIGLAPTLLWRRTHPLLVLTVAFGVTGLAPLATGQAQAYTLAFLLILPYTLTRWASGRDVLLGLAVLAGTIGLSLAAGGLSLASAFGGVAVLAAGLALGAALRFRANARARAVEQIRLLERERLARDLHDTVAHHVSAMAIRAQAGLATMGARPEAAADALRVIEAEASRALAELRTMVRVLRRDAPADLTPSRIRDLEQLGTDDRTDAAVRVRIVGEVDDLPPSVHTAIYRLAQESVTNARRHARHATRIDVRVDADATSVQLKVSDDGDSGALPGTAPPGYGLVGMMERASLLGGTCEAGPDPVRGWTVTATLPRTGPVA